MPYIIDYHGWQLFQQLRHYVNKRKARFKYSPLHPNPGSHGAPPLPTLASLSMLESTRQFDAQLRALFCLRLHDDSRVLSDTEFKECKAKLETLCSHLNGLVHPDITSPDEMWACEKYPRLHCLVKLLEKSHKTFNVAIGTGTLLFEVPENPAGLKQGLALITDCTEFLQRLLVLPSPETAYHSAMDNAHDEKVVWEDCRLRDRATAALAALLQPSTCGMNHETLLKISAMLDSNRTILPAHLELIVSSCPINWLVIQCDPTPERNPDTPGMQKMKSICDGLARQVPQEQHLIGCIERGDRRFDVWVPLTPQPGIPVQPGKTLEQLISNGHFTKLSLKNSTRLLRYRPLEKRQLAVRLGYCLMDFFDVDLSPTRFHVIDSSAEATVSRNKMLYLSFTSVVTLEMVDARPFRLGHPALLSLARLLFEIEFGETLPVDIGSDYGANTKIWTNLNEKLDDVDGHVEFHYLQAIRGCLNVHTEISRELKQGGDTRALRELTIRKYLYNKIVRYLEKSLEIVRHLETPLEKSGPRTSCKRQRSESPEPAPQRRARQFREPEEVTGRGIQTDPQPSLHGNLVSRMSETARRSPLRNVTVAINPPQKFGGMFDDCSSEQYPLNTCTKVDKMIDFYRLCYDNAIQYEDDTSLPRIKVAVLDTGVDKSTPSIRANSERIKEIKSWLPPRDGREPDGTDTCGHGTHVTGLLLTMAPDCDVYVAQIADENGTISPGEIAKAIDHAREEWQVDILSMSFGFTDETEPGCDELRTALTEAHAKGILMFAAASNTGAFGHPVSGPAFPARHSNVFCVFAGDSMGNSIWTNPTPRPNRFNFLALGEAVESAWPRSLGVKPWKKRKSGTSFATPIMAGLVAAFLLYAYQNKPEEDARKFKEFDRMQAWLEKESNLLTPRQGYNVLPLSRFFSQTREARNQFLDMLLAGKQG
ncbi:hypothetical protein OQA88_5871 [Cercophora sp. LCS_1]